ncbi:MAG: TIM barrel protein [Burkholderiaceae bacterium]
MKLAANLSWLYPQMAWDQRFAGARHDGFDAVEMLLPYDHPPTWYADQLRAHDLTMVLFNTPVGPDGGKMGLAAIPGAQAQFQSAFDQARAVADATGCRRIHCMAGNTAGLDSAACRQTLLRNLAHALPLAERDGLTLTLEPLNRFDAPDYFYHQPAEVIAILQQLQSPALRLQLDYYHCARESLNLLQTARDAAPWIGHVQIAGAPVRNEPDLSSDDWLDAVALLPTIGYDSWLSCEYAPRTTAAEGLHWCQPLRDRGLLE